MAASTRVSERPIEGGALKPVYIAGQDVDLDVAFTVNGAAVSDANPMPVDDAGGSLTVDVNGVIPGVAANNLGKAEDQLSQSGDVGVAMLGVRNDADAIQTDVDLDYTTPNLHQRGWQKVVDTWTPSLYADEDTNDSDKTIIVNPNYIWHILWIWIELTTTATVGNRQIVVEIQDVGNDVVGQFRAGATQAASLTYYYMFAPSLADLTAMRDTDYLMTPLPPTLILPSSYQIRVYDNNAVDAAADDMVVQLGFAYRYP